MNCRRLSMDLGLGVTLAHEYAHHVYKWRVWKEKFAAKPYTHVDQELVDYCSGSRPQPEHCFDASQLKDELVDAWEQATMEGRAGFNSRNVTVSGVEVLNASAGKFPPIQAVNTDHFDGTEMASHRE
jgi:hypothetical protein